MEWSRWKEEDNNTTYRSRKKQEMKDSRHLISFQLHPGILSTYMYRRHGKSSK